MSYQNMAYQQLRNLVRERRIEVRGDSRKKHELVAALEAADERIKNPPKPAVEESKNPDDMSDLERKLAKVVPSGQRMKMGRDYTGSRNIVEEQMRVRNLPAQYAYAWASTTAANGEDVGRWTSLGWVRVTEDMVTSNPNVDDKIYVANYEISGGYVMHKDCVLVIADRRLLEERKQANIGVWNNKVEKLYGKRGEVTRDQISDPTQSSGAKFRRAAQWRAEDMVEGGRD